MEKRKIVTGIGELLWDMLPQGKQIGGAPFNFSFHAAQAGCEAHVVSAIGNDDSGAEILKSMAFLNLADKYIQSGSRPTGRVDVTLNKEGHPDYTIIEDVAWDHIAWNNDLASLAPVTDAVCFGSLAQRNNTSRMTILNFLEAVSPNCLKVFDINLRQNFYNREILLESLQHANILKLNEEELPVVASLFSLEGNSESQLVKLSEIFGLDYIAYTMGSKGSLLIGREESSFVEAPEVLVVDTVGAGDSFTALLVTGILNEIPLNEIHKKATEIAAIVCTRAGATPLIDKALMQFSA
jgi:fructokinase